MFHVKHRGWLVLVGLMVAACQRPLPEPDTLGARLYVGRCGSCHQAYDPRGLTAPMWQLQVDAMAPKMAAAGQAALSRDEQRMILDYLRRNAGHG